MMKITPIKQKDLETSIKLSVSLLQVANGP